MPTFFLDVTDGTGTAEDEEGLDCETFEHAHAQAIKGIRSLLAAEILNGRLDLNGSLTLRDAQRRELAEIPFSEALEIIPADDE